MKQHLLSALTLALVASAVQAAPAAGTGAAGATAKSVKAPVLSSGVATEYIEQGVRPQDDFFQYLNGKWLKDTEIPADKASWGSFMQLRENTLPRLRGIIEKSAATNPAAATDAQRIGDFYAGRNAAAG
jgi:putative endopeptidase